MAREVTVGHAKTHLSELLRSVEAGEEILIRRGAEPVALLTRAPRRTTEGKRRIWGDLTGGGMAEDFDELGPEWAALLP